MKNFFHNNKIRVNKIFYYYLRIKILLIVKFINFEININNFFIIKNNLFILFQVKCF